MLRHIVLLTLSEEAGPDEIAAIRSSLGGLPAVVPEIEAYSFDVDLGLVEGNASVAIIGDFADAAAYHAYAENPDHLAVIAEKIKPFVVGRSAVQIALD